MDPTAQFIFTVCQIGTESALKDEIAREWPDFRFSYSRPGFVTFKLPEGFCVSNDFDLFRMTFDVFRMTFDLLRMTFKVVARGWLAEYISGADRLAAVRAHVLARSM